jgi:DNA polymerase III sliding clamp (beta) subunit (PCNA family)
MLDNKLKICYDIVEVNKMEVIKMINEKDLKKLEKCISKEEYRIEDFGKVVSCEDFSIASDTYRVGIVFHNENKNLDCEINSDPMKAIINFIPKDFDFELRFRRKEFLSLLKDSFTEFKNKFAENDTKINKKKTVVKMKFEATNNIVSFRLHSSTNEFTPRFCASGDYEFKVVNTIFSFNCNKDYTIGINYEYLVDMFNFFDNQYLNLQFSHSNRSPFMAEDGNKKMVVCPIRLSEEI